MIEKEKELNSDSLQLVALVSLQIGHSLWAQLLPVIQLEQMLWIANR